MKKVELITLQNVPNYGSVLQCYATEQIIKKFGYEIETINYLPERMTKIGMLKNIKEKSKRLHNSILLRTIARIIIFPSYLLRFKTFQLFRKNNLNMTKKIYKVYEDFERNIPYADIYCTGSDQVWNSDWNNEIDKALFLEFVPKGKKCIAYAASFGKEKLDNAEKEETKTMLTKYKYISTREKSGVEILNSLGLKGENVLDPTLLLTGEEWRKISSKRFLNEKYILVYNLNRNKKIDNYAKKISSKTGYKIKYLSYQLHEFYKKGKMYCNPKVEDFIALIDNAECVVTDSFHAVAFSINLSTPFAIVYPKKFSTRLQSILSILDLNDRVVKNDNTEVINNMINYKEVQEILNKEREKSLQWFETALKK